MVADKAGTPLQIFHTLEGEYGKVCKLWAEFQQFTKLEVGNGAKNKFWIDFWTGDECLKQKISSFFQPLQ